METRPIEALSTRSIDQSDISGIRFERRISRIPTDLELTGLSGLYSVDEKIAEGGQSEVFRAFDRSLKREVAIKRLKLRPGNPEKQSKAFADFIVEARLSARLEHPAIVPLYGLFCGDTPEELNLAMKLLRGQTLQEHLEFTRNIYSVKKNTSNEEVAFEERLRLFYRIAKAIEYAHSRGVIHCDLKPQNLMLGDYDEVYVMDWGIAYFFDPENPDDSALRPPVGTPAYLAPELRHGAKPSPQTDVFSLGMILFEMVTLRPAVTGESANEVLHKIEKGDLSDFHHLLPGFPLSSDLGAIVRKATAIDPAERYRTVTDLCRDLQSFRYGRAVSARPDTPLRAVVRFVMRRHLLLLAIFGLLGALVLGMGVFILNRENTHISRNAALEREHNSIHSAALNRAQKFDRNFLYLAAELDALGGIAERLLTVGDGHPQERIYFQDEFNLSAKIPSDIIYSPYYRKPISLKEISFMLAPGVSAAQGTPIALRLGCMSSFFHRALANPGPEQKNDTPDDQIIASGGLLTGIYIGTVDGVFGYYPGNRHYANGFDPRRHPWFILGAGAHLPRWGRSHLSASKTELVIPCSLRLHDPDGKTLGVIGLLVSHERVRSLLGETLPGAHRALVTPDGLLVLDDHTDREPPPIRSDGFPEFKTFEFAGELAQLITHNPEGGSKSFEGGYLVALKLQSLNLYYVEVIPKAAK